MVIFHSELLVYQRVEVSFSQVEFEPPQPVSRFSRACNRSEKKVKPGCKDKESRPGVHIHKVWGRKAAFCNKKYEGFNRRSRIFLHQMLDFT